MTAPWVATPSRAACSDGEGLLDKIVWANGRPEIGDGSPSSTLPAEPTIDGLDAEDPYAAYVPAANEVHR